jgi:hypothetical protein
MTNESNAINVSFDKGCMSVLLSNGKTFTLTKAQTRNLMLQFGTALADGKSVQLHIPMEWLKDTN